MDLRATLTPATWHETLVLRGPAAMDELADWFAEHIGLPLRYRAQPGDEAVIIRAATITSTRSHLVCELEQVLVGPRDTVERLDDEPQVRGFELLRDPPFWVQPKLGFGLDAQRPDATSGDARPSGSGGTGEDQTPEPSTPGSTSTELPDSAGSA